jgi:hypothetical protein
MFRQPRQKSGPGPTFWTRPLAKLVLVADKITIKTFLFLLVRNTPRIFWEQHHKASSPLNNPDSSDKLQLCSRITHRYKRPLFLPLQTIVLAMAATSVEVPEPHKLFDTILTLDFG